jgi:NTE family protein
MVMAGKNSGLFLALLLALLSACSTVYQPTNEAISVIDEEKGYRRLNEDRCGRVGDTLMLLAFSGGGTRAAALSYGVMQ